MKTLVRLLAFALGIVGLVFSAPTAAQAQVGVNVQIGAPTWGPPVPQGTQYYYIPEIDGYYDIYNGVYLVFDGNQWVQLPYIDGYDPYYFHPVPVSYVGPQPWLYIGSYRRYYPQYVTGFRRGGYGYAGRYGGRDYGAGRVYGYDHGRDGRGYNYPGNGGQPGNFPPQPNPGHSPQPGNPGGGQPGPGRGGFGGHSGGIPGGGGQPGHGFGNGGNAGGWQPGGGHSGFGGQHGGGGRRGR